METGAGELTEATLSLLQTDHAIASLICLVAHQYDGYVQGVFLQRQRDIDTQIEAVSEWLAYLAGGAQFASSLVVVNEELEAAALIEGALVCDGVNENECIGPAYIRLQCDAVQFLQDSNYPSDDYILKVLRVRALTCSCPVASSMSNCTDSLSSVVWQV